jgi:hypothetical protein
MKDISFDKQLLTCGPWRASSYERALPSEDFKTGQMALKVALSKKEHRGTISPRCPPMCSLGHVCASIPDVVLGRGRAPAISVERLRKPRKLEKLED